MVTPQSLRKKAISKPVMPIFTSNYPAYQTGLCTLLPTHERTSARPDFIGRGVVMAFIDAGFYPHPDLAGRIKVHVDASTNRVVEQSADFQGSDLSWHGQMTSVIAAGDGRTSGGKYRGIASGAEVVLVKVSTPKGHIKETDILRGLRWVIDTHQRLNIRVVNISVGGDFASSDPNHPLHKAIRKLTKAGVTVVIAAGNRNVDYLLPPASAPEAIIVGGIDDHNTLDQSRWTAYHHNFGKAHDGSGKPDLLAPAAWLASPIMPGSSVEREAYWLAPLLTKADEKHVRKLIKRGHSDLGLTVQANSQPDEHLYAVLQQRIHAHKLIDAHHQHVDGTSVAATIVSAIIAQMLEANPRLTTQQIRAILTDTAKPLANIPIERQGSGVINAPGAVLAALNFA
jgi:serine protease AprX